MLTKSSLLKTLGIVATFSLIVACTNTKTDVVVAAPAVDSPEWASWVEQKITTTDNAAHGPDVGEAEWCNVVEQKLFKAQSGLQPCSLEWRNKVTDVLRK